MTLKDYGSRFDRMYVAPVLPYKNDSFEIDETALRQLLRYFMQSRFINAGGAMIINPEAGEIFYLTSEEKRRNVKIAVEECHNKVPLIAGVCGNTTEEAIQVARDAKELGVDGIFMMPPIGAADITRSWDADKYPEIWVDMTRAVDDVVDLPIITHPSGGNWLLGRGLPPSAAKIMVEEIPNIVGWKMTYNYDGYRKIASLLRSLDRHVAILTAGGDLFHEALASDTFDGTVSGSWNYALEPMLDHIEAWRRSDVVGAKKIWNSGLLDLHMYVYGDRTRLHIRYKISAWLRGLVPHPFMRPPLPRPKKEEVLTLKKLMKNVDLKMIDDRQVEDTINLLEGRATQTPVLRSNQ